MKNLFLFQGFVLAIFFLLLLLPREIKDFIINFSNRYQAIVSFMSLFLVIPFAIVSNKFIQDMKDKRISNDISLILINEIWINLSYVQQIFSTYEKNIDNTDMHIPYSSPRTIILDKFISYDPLYTLDRKNLSYVVEIYYQLSELKREYFEWRKLVFNGLNEDKELYITRSESMVRLIRPVMKNMLDLWITLIIKYGSKSDNPKIIDLNMKINKLIHDGKKIRALYKSSHYTSDLNANFIICWINDLDEDKGIEILEIKELASLDNKSIS